MGTGRPLVLITALVGALTASACGDRRLGVAQPELMLTWPPRPGEASARITTVKRGPRGIYVGFSDGEMFLKANGASDWSRYDRGPSPCDQPTPAGPVTSFALTEGTIFAAYGGPRGAFGIWRSMDDQPCWASIPISASIWSLSVSPFSSIQLLALSHDFEWVSHDLGGLWTNDPHDLSLDFEGWPQALASGAGPSGRPRAWLGDRNGSIYYSDDTPKDGDPPAAPTWSQVREPRFPARPVVALTTHPDRPTTVWATFAGLQPDSLWTSDDAGASWRNPGGGELPTAVAPTAGPATFTGVSAIPDVGVVCVTALVPDAIGNVVPTTFWSSDGSDEWWRL